MQSQGITHEIRAILDDGEWHAVSDLVNQVKHLIPPEVAVRSISYGNPPHSLTWRLHKGRRRVVIKAVSKMLHNWHEVEVRREAGAAKIVAARKL